MRTKNSVINLSAALVGQIFGIIISFVSRLLFVKILGQEYLGLNGLFTNILTILSLVELGVGPALTYSLYKPLAEKDKEKVKSLMWLYKKVYIAIGVIVIALGIIMLPFYRNLIDEVPNIANLDLIFLLFVLNTAISYFYSYKKSLVICDQKRYIATIYHYVALFLLNVVQIMILIITKNYIFFLICQVFFTWIENYLVSKKADKMYPYLKEKNIRKIDKTETKEIKKNVSAMLFHKIGGAVVNSTDNIIMSKYVGLISVGLYSNYYMITQALENIILQVFNAIVASVGNLTVTEDVKKVKNIFNKIFFLDFAIFAFCTTCLIVLFNDFIKIWLGANYLFSFEIVVLISIVFYLKGIRRAVLTFRDATGTFYYDRYKPLVEAVINLVVSILLAQKMGVAGIFLGTIISTITTSLWVEPVVLYKHVFHMGVLDYFKRLFTYTIIGVMIFLVVSYVCSWIIVTGWLMFTIKVIICALLMILLLSIVFFKTEEFQYFFNLAKNIMINIWKKIRKRV